MTAITGDARPSSITLLEQEVLRQLLMLQQAAKGVNTREEGGVINPVLVLNFKTNDAGENYVIARVVLPVSALVSSGAATKPYLLATAIPGTLASIPAGFNV